MLIVKFAELARRFRSAPNNKLHVEHLELQAGRLLAAEAHRFPWIAPRSVEDIADHEEDRFCGLWKVARVAVAMMTSGLPSKFRVGGAMPHIRMTRGKGTIISGSVGYPSELTAARAFDDADTCDVLHALCEPTKAPSRKRRRTAVTKPLTSLQQQALELYAKHNGKLADVAREMGVSHPTVSKHLSAAWRKLPNLVPSKGKHGRTRRLPHDRRGQANL